MTEPQNPIEGEIRNAVLLERYKQQLVDEFAPFLRSIDKHIRDQLLGQDLTEFNRSRLDGLLKELSVLLGTEYDSFVQQMVLDFGDLAVQQAGVEAAILNASIPVGVKLTATVPALQTLKTAAFKNPLSIHGIGGDALLDSFIKDWTVKDIGRVESAIRQGWFEGQTTAQIVKNIRGTKALNYKDGILEINRRNATAVVHTAVQHVATQARNQTMIANSDIVQKVEFVATLDNRTTQVCRSLDGQLFDVDKGPRPPLHTRCRSTLSPRTKWSAMFDESATRASVGQSGGKQVDADLTYYQWIKTQPASFQDIAIGPVRGKLLRDGGIDAQKFADLQLDRNFKPITLDEMRKLEPEMFKRAGL